MSEPQASIPKGSIVLVTGATGYVASNITRQLLERGYRVRGTVRDLSQATWLTDETVFPHAKDHLELVLVKDLSVPHAFDEAVKGVSAIIHPATITNLDPDPANVVPPTVLGAVGILEAAKGEPSVRQVVYTSTIVAATFPSAGNKTFVRRDTWNDAATPLAYQPPPYGPAQWFFTYAESKAAAEKAVWRFVDEETPHFAVNVISPSGILGAPLHTKHVGSVADWMSVIFKGDVARLSQTPGGYFIDVEDVAALHIAAALDPDTKSARLQTWGHPVYWNEMLSVMRGLRPEHEFIPDFEDKEDEASRLLIGTDQRESVALLRKWTGRGAWKSMEQAIAENLASPLFPY